MIKFVINDTGYEHIVQLLVEKGANANVKSNDNDTALIDAVREGKHKH